VVEAARLKEDAAREAGARLVRVAEARKVAKVEAGREEISREVREANRTAAAIRVAGEHAAADPKARRLLELRAQGKTMAEAFEIIESEGENGHG
jgi:hypothetical protein